MRQTHHITSDLSSWSSREVHQDNERVLLTSNKNCTKNIKFLFYILHHHYNMQTQYSLKRQSISQFFIFSAGAKFPRVVQLESMPGYKYPNIDSGATPIRSAGRAPDRKIYHLRKNLTTRRRRRKRWWRRKLEPMIDYKYPTIASGATPIGSAGHAPDEDLLWEDHQWRARKKILSPLSVASTRK
jgi:hypothetical protein